jgi:Protein of unknown function (DUF1203)
MTITTEARTKFQVRAIPADVLDELRERDDAGNPPRIRTDQSGGSPLRCCLRLSAPAEEIALVSYAPLRRWARRTGADPGPYDEVGPVFIHPGPCAGPDGTGYPAALAGRPRVLRAYGADGTIRGGRLAGQDELRDPAAAASVISEVLDDPEVAVVHVRAVDFGCFSFEIARS